MRKILRGGAVFICALASVLIARGDLRLVCDIDGKPCAPVAIKSKIIEVEGDGDTRETGTSGGWRLEGDLRANADLLLLSPNYTLCRKNFRDGQPDDGCPMRGNAGIRHVTVHPQTGKEQESEFLQQWPGGVSDERALLVIAWMIDGRASDVRVCIVPPTRANDFILHATFKLTPAQSAGQPVILLWQNGRFVPPEPGMMEGIDRKAVQAVIFDDAESLRALLAKGVKPDMATKKRGITLLHLAAEANSLRAMDVLIKAAPQLVRTQSKEKAAITPLEWAVGKGRTEATARLLRANAILNRRVVKHHGFAITPLMAALAEGHDGVAKQLLDAGADVFDPKTAKRSAFDIAVMAGDVSMTKLLLGGRPPRPKLLEDYMGGDIIRHQLRRGHLEMALWLLEQGVPINDTRQTLRTLLEMADRKNDGAFAALVEKALALAADRKPETNERHALVLAQGSSDGAVITRTITKNGAQGIPEPQPLTEAARADYPLLVKKLIDAGARVNKAESNGDRPLHAAAKTNAIEAARVLLDNGALLDATNSSGANALDVALQNDAKDMALMLAAKGVRINPKYERATHSLDGALRMDIAEVAGPLLAAGFGQDGLSRLRLVAEGYQAVECLKLPEIQNAPASPQPGIMTENASAPEKLTIALKPGMFSELADPRNPMRIWPACNFNMNVLVDAAGKSIFAIVVPEKEDGSRPPLALQSVARKVIESRTFRNARSENDTSMRWIPVNVRFPAMDYVDLFFSEEVDEPMFPIEPRATPMYPGKALFDRKAGFVMIAFVVNPTGVVDQLDVIKGTDGFEQAASAAVRRWKFKPAKKDGVPVSARVAVPIQFNP